MHIYFSGIGGSGIGPLSLLAHQIGHEVSGSDKYDSRLISYLRDQGIKNISINQSYETIELIHQNKSIDWFVYSSAITSADGETISFEMKFCREHQIKMTKRDELLNQILEDKQMKMIAIAGTHGKSTTTSMIVWLFNEFNRPISYSIGAQMIDGRMAQYDHRSKYFIYEADEYDRNFLSFYPLISIITGIDWDHPDIYPTKDIYFKAFEDFSRQSKKIFLWKSDLNQLNIKRKHQEEEEEEEEYLTIMNDDDRMIDNCFRLIGHVNRRNAFQSVQLVHYLTKISLKTLIERINDFPGVSRRFEKICQNLFSDYAHTTMKIRGALNCAEEINGNDFIVLYEGFQNVRQHLMKNDFKHLFDRAKEIYLLPIYFARENSLISKKIFNCNDIRNFFSIETQMKTRICQLDDQLKLIIEKYLQMNQLVLCLSAGTTNSLDHWLRKTFGK